MRVVRVGLTPLKGMAHLALDSVELALDGPVGDRVFCLVDPATHRVLRTVEDDALMACRAEWTDPVLTIRTPIGTVTGEVEVGSELTADYWGRTARLREVRGPWAELLSAYAGRPVVLCRTTPGEIIWAGSVSIVTTASLAELARRVGRVVDDGARFRATFVVDTGDDEPFAEDRWQQVRLGDAVLRVRGPLARCAVVDRHPARGGHDLPALKALAHDRTKDGEILFGISADVVRPGIVNGRWVAPR
ncbi:MOSC domain-containing protein [Tenggerimyces flavus]|uniref:MOSC domain-containing protein n=1 Tax=Tenggerimyces flavus TaxID=1708749 RepID=A0ABV7YDY0_9ACTN|nr:MOSC domain-containing protein [Tenggerimyces flavus]MBM7787053.1 uncharacterized protein YcbX [Tenggerimyces flavus]